MVKLTSFASCAIILLIPDSLRKAHKKLLRDYEVIQVDTDEVPFTLTSGRIYVIDPACYPEVSHGHLTCSKETRQIQLTPEDHFFKSIAEHYKTRGVGVAFGNSGRIGLSIITGAGGQALASSAFLDQFPEMLDLVDDISHVVIREPIIENELSEEQERIEDLKMRAETREKQQAVVARLSLMALSGTDLDTLFQAALEQVVETLQADYGKILKYQPGQNNFLLVYGMGWKDGLVGKVTVPDSKDSQAGFTLLCEDTIIVQDIAKETRFTGSPLFVDHEVVSGMSCVINHSSPVYGVFGVHTREKRQFTQDDANFLLSVANMLSTAIKYTTIQTRLFESEEQFRTMANSIPQLAWMTDATGWIFWYNKRWFEFTGTTINEMKGWGWTKVHHPDHLDRVMAKFKDRLEKGTEWEDTFPIRRKDGEYRWFLSRARPIRNESGEIINWFGTNTDITNQLEIERALFESEQKLRIAKNASNVGAFEYYLTHEETEWDAMLKEIWGIPVDMPVDQEHFWEGVHPEDREKTDKAIRRAIDPSGDGHYHCEYRVVHKLTGKISHIESSGQVIFENGQPLKMIGLVIDITHRKDLELSLHKAIRDLEHTNAKKNEFLATLGHELRNPLASISGGIQLMQLEDNDREELRIMSNGVNQMASLLDDLLDLTRIERGKFRLDRKPVNLSYLFSSVSNSNKSMMDARNQKFSIKDPGKPVYVEGDETRLEQIISNLLTNASKFTPPEGIISIELYAEENVRIIVTDSGIGLAPEKRDLIFNPFEQVDNGHNRGLGIGLSLVRQFVEMHEGSIQVFSEGLGKGSKFEVILPLLKEIPAETSFDQEINEEVLNKKLKILIVEDNTDAARGLEALLNRAGCEVQIATSGQDTLEMLKAYSPEVFILDIGLPDINGYDLIRMIRELPDINAVFIAHTGYGHESAQFKSKTAGFDFHLNKPVKMSELMKILTSI